MNKTLLLIIGVLVGIILVGIALFFIFVPKQELRSHSEKTFVIEEKYDRIKKILVRGKALEEVIKYQQGEVVQQSWQSLGVTSQNLLGPFNIEGEGKFIVKRNDPDEGVTLLEFKRIVDIRQDGLKVTTELVQPSGHLKEYRTVLTVIPQGESTSISVDISAIYCRRIPKRMLKDSQERFDYRIASEVVKTHEALAHLFLKYQDKKIIIPLK